jgi:hypothetical protein
MVVWILLLQFYCFSVHAIDAVVTVLETPLFEAPDQDSKILQYLRKGDVLGLHPSVKKNNRYHQLGPDATSDEELYQNTYQEYQNEFPDPLFKNEIYNFQEGDEYVLTVTKRKRPAYVKRSHIHIYYETAKELSQEKLSYDPTDYRINEPLPKDYPFIKPSGHRGFFSIGTGTYNRSYFPTPGTVVGQSTGNRADIMFAWSSQIEFDDSKRLFFGALINYTNMSRTLQYADRELQEGLTQFSLGPHLNYEAFRTDEYVWSLQLSMTANLINKLTITQQDSLDTEERVYSKMNFSARTGVMYQRKKVYQDFLDFVVLATMHFEPPTEFSTNSTGGNSSWWNNTTFTQKFVAEFTLSAGFQSAY